MNSNEQQFMPKDVKEMLRRHTKLNAHKVVSYLPINTIENVMQISLATYTSLIESNGGSYLIFDENECCISSGAAYAFLPNELRKALKTNEDVLASAGLPHEPVAFIRAIADRWFENGTEVAHLLKMLFDD